MLCLSLLALSLSRVNSAVPSPRLNSTILAEDTGAGGQSYSLGSLTAFINTKRWSAWKTGWKCWTHDQKHKSHNVTFPQFKSEPLCCVRNRQVRFCFSERCLIHNLTEYNRLKLKWSTFALTRPAVWHVLHFTLF